MTTAEASSAADGHGAAAPRALRLALIAGEHSGDALGAKLIEALVRAHPGEIRYVGVGGEHMAAQGLRSIFPLEEVAVMGPMSIVPRLPRIVRRVYAAVDAVLAFEPDAVVIIDSPEFTHPIAKRIRKRRPSIPIIDYVSPSVWAWRPGRAAKMRAYVDHVMALLPFEPEAHRRLGGPPCTYVGHPMIERYGAMRAEDGGELRARLGLDAGGPVLVVLPGSRPSEVVRLMRPFGDAVGRLAAQVPGLQVVLPAVGSVRRLLDAGLADWSLQPHVVTGDADKIAAFRLADAALAASGTVTLELALAGAPMVVAYRVDAIAARLRFLIKVPSIVLANLVLGENAFPEYIQEACTGEKLAAAVAPLLSDTPARRAQLAALARMPDRMLLDHGSPSDKAAGLILAAVRG